MMRHRRLHNQIKIFLFYQSTFHSLGFIRNISADGSDDNELIARFKKSGDENIAAVLYDRYIEMIYAVCVKYLKDSEAAKDAVMEVFTQISLKLQKHEVLNFKSWLYTLTKNHCLMQLRSASNKKTVPLEENIMHFTAEMHQDDGNEKEFQLNQLNDCMETLSSEQRLVIDLFYLQRRSYKEIAEQKQMDWNKVRSLVQNGRRNLKICMDRKIQIEEK
jgi:RNA polymerase sigma-70 factor (ECF subfamily)